MRTNLLPLLSLLAACADYELTMGNHTDRDDATEDSDTGESDALVTLRVDVTPPTTPDGRFDGLRPQTFAQVPFDASVTLELLDPVTLSGTVTAWSSSPWPSAVPPGEAVVVQGADVSLLTENTVHTTYTQTDEDGRFSISAVPDVGYRLTIVPDDAGLPMFTVAAPMSENTELVLELETGTPVWGTMFDEDGEPIADAYVFLENASGIVSSPTTTDADGHWVLHASSGQSYTVLAQAALEGTLLSEAPIVASDEFTLSAEGAEIDITYADPTAIPLTGTVEMLDGSPAEDIVVRVTSVSLEDYPNGTLTVTTDTDRNGDYTAWLVPGEYTVELMPPDSSQTVEITPRLVGESGTVVVSGSASTPVTSTLLGFTSFSGTVVDPQGDGVPNTLVQCAEAGFSGRSFSTYADDFGVFSIYGPATELDCVLSPPDSTGLGITRTGFDGGETSSPTLVVETGIDLIGTVLYDGLPVEYASVSIRSNSDRLWAITVTDQDGDFNVRVAVPDR